MQDTATLTSRENQRVPDVDLHVIRDHALTRVSTAELFDGKTVILFALPGAFTPTCSSTHLPRYEALHAAFREHGVDDILCLSVNDAFVMQAWGDSQHAEHVRLVADGSAAFSRGMGMAVNKDDLGFGERSWRYSMLVRDGVIEKMFIEPQQPGDPFEVSDADTMLAYLDPDAQVPSAAVLFTRPGCPHCARARDLLADNGQSYEEIELGSGLSADTLQAVAGATSSPQVFIDGQHIGGADELEAFYTRAAA